MILVSTHIFKAHSVRSVYAIAAANGNVSLDMIMKSVGWSATSTFQKFYVEPVLRFDYCKAVLWLSELFKGVLWTAIPAYYFLETTYLLQRSFVSITP